MKIEPELEAKLCKLSKTEKVLRPWANYCLMFYTKEGDTESYVRHEYVKTVSEALKQADRYNAKSNF